MLIGCNASTSPRARYSKRFHHSWMRTALVILACLLISQWARAQCSVSLATTPQSPLLAGQDITLNASLSGSGVGHVTLDGQLVCGSLPCSTDLGSNVAVGIHTVGWVCTASGGGNFSGSQQLVVGQGAKGILPSFYILSLLYAPPGNASNNGFTNSTDTGTSSSITKSFNQNTTTNIGFNIPLGNIGSQAFSFQTGGSVGFELDSSDATSFTETLTNATGTTVTSSVDPLSHYQDRFFIWLNPLVTVFQTSSNQGAFTVSVPNDPSGNPVPAAVVDVTVAELLNPSQIPLQKFQSQTINGVTVPGLSSICKNQVACTLTNACGCTAGDFATIVQQDPLVFDPNNPNTEPNVQPNVVDSIRYVLKDTQLLQGPDCPPPTCTPVQKTFSETDATENSNTTTETDQYSVSFNTGFTLGIFNLSQTNTFTWSDAVAIGNSHGSSTAGSVTFSSTTPQCSDNYNIYEDTRFHTFAFAPASPTPACLTPTPDFNVVAFPPSNLPQTVINGGSATYLVSTVGMLGFNGAETLSVSGMPAGMTASSNPASFNLTPTSSTGTAILTITAGNGVTPAGNYPLNVIGTGGGLSHSAPIQINVQDFQLTVTPNSPNVTTNGTTTYTITVTPQNGFNSTVSFGLSALPPGVNGTLSPTSITGSGTSTLTITTSGASPGNSTFTVSGVAGTDSQTATGTLSVVDFSVSATPSSQTLAQGGSITYSVSTTANNGFGDAISLSVTGLPSGVTATFNPPTISGSGNAILTLTASLNAALGSAPLSINGVSRGVTRTAGVAVVVNPPPAISSVSPTQAAVGAFITVTGSNFNGTQGSSTITIGGVPGSPTSWGNTSIVVPVPPGLTTGGALIVVTVNGSSSNNGNFSVTPGITGIAPVSGPVGTVITITGTNFGASQGSSTVSIGGVVGSIVSWSNTSVSASVPLSLGPGNAPVVVTVGGLASNSVNFSVGPGITSLSPVSGPVGTSVTITGTNFGSTQGSSTVTFGGTLATPSSWSSTSIVVAAPGLSVGSVSVVVTVNGQASNSANYTFAPGITSLSPSSGPVGTSVTISGNDFGATQGSSTVTVGGVSVTPTSWSDTSVAFTVPSSLGLGAAPVIVTVGGVSSAGTNFTVTPGITSFSPASGPVGSSITINGTNFGATQGTSTVTFAGISTTPTSWSAGSIVVPVPVGLAAGNNPVVVTVNGLSSPGVNFAVAPGITSLSPVSGPVGTLLIISGTSFGTKQNASTVAVGGIAVSPTSWSDTVVKAPVPASLGLGATPVVITVAGLSSPGVSFTVTPGISNLSPSSAPVGSTVTITGTNFGSSQGASTVTIAGTAVTPGSWSNTAIQFVVPSSLGLGTVPVVVTVGGAASNTPNFTVTPGITSLSPASGPVGTSVTINGTNFGPTQGSSSLSFAGGAITPSSWSNASIVFSVPNVSPGNANVAVTVNGLTSNVASFTVTPVISNLSLISGPVGTAITITGSNFGASQGASSVTFAGIAASVGSWSNASIAVTVPAGLGSGSSPVIVAVNGAASNSLFFTATPSITSLSPTSGSPGTTVTINGSAFGASQGTSTVTFNGTSATVSSWSNTTVIAKVPSNATTGNVVITVNSIPSNGVTFTVTAPRVFFQSGAASATSGLLQLQTTTPTSPTNIQSADLINQPPGQYVIQAFNTQSGVPGSSAVWQAGLSATITVYMNQVAGTTGALFPSVALFLNSPSGTPICSATGASALTTTQTLYTLSCSASANVTLTPSDQYYLSVGVNSTATSTSSETVQLTVGPPSRGKQGGTLTVPVQ